ncbi:AlpA family transcriptional regulator [Vibrio hannami]|uniref:helix-turn-helix transcriptional regulator n=1 Tax=Vibrio hannami TaxID=2717094 RepID=UPI00240FD6C2|nr:AlpA family transcriptional regulator [Vibrio hannami]MDG3087811.1 AlpA family transcriptional regulator [Vibrio hannami]
MSNIKIIRLSTVKDMTGISKSSIYQRISEGQFPKPIKLGRGGGAVGWVEQEIIEWIEQKIKERDCTMF